VKSIPSITNWKIFK